MIFHDSVMLAETLEHLKVKKDGLYIDATLGDGGHSIGILEQGGRVLGIDYDEKAVQRAEDRIRELGFGDSFVGAVGNFKNIEEIAIKNGFSQVHGIVYDLGYSSTQLDRGEKGLSFLADEPLDMRLDATMGVSAADLIGFLNEEQLTKLIFEYSDEKMARRFARAIVENRNLKKIQTTKQLADILASATPSGYEHGRIHPATRTFQALRIAVNDELVNLTDSLPRAARLLLPGSRMVVISFHSKEDELVKKFGQGAQPTKTLVAVVKKPLVPSDDEINKNVRARSAKMRVFEKTSNDK
jgi:16S rRNA (cytosine1402-N4)-methyltransferase